MNKAFSHFQSIVLDESKKEIKNIKKHGEVNYPDCQGVKSIDHLFTVMYHRTLRLMKDPKQHMPYFYQIFIAECLVKNNCVNYYIDSIELTDFFKSIPNYDDGIIVQSIKEYEIKKIANHYNSMTPVLIHFKREKRSIAFVINELNGQFQYYITDGEDHTGGMSNFISTQLNNTEFINIVINFLLYKTCFPEKISKTPPKCNIEYNGNKNCYMVSESSEIISREGKRAHFRRGHYRLLKSEKYVNKKGKIVYVKSSFVGKEKQYTVNEKTQPQG